MAPNETRVSADSSVGQKPSRLGWALCLGSRKAEVKGSTKLDSYLEALGRNPLPNSSRYWQNPVPCGCGTEVPASLLAASQGRPLSAPRHHPSGLLYLQRHQQCIKSPSCPEFPTSSSAAGRENSLLLRDHVIRSGPPGESPCLKVNCAI